MPDKIDWAGRRELVRQVSTGEFCALEFFPDGRIFCSELLDPASASNVVLSRLKYDEDISWDFEPELFEEIRSEPLI